jgi:hypothetical protein
LGAPPAFGRQTAYSDCRSERIQNDALLDLSSEIALSKAADLSAPQAVAAARCFFRKALKQLRAATLKAIAMDPSNGCALSRWPFVTL